MQTGGEILGRQEEIHSRGFDLTSPRSGFMTRTEYLDKYGKDTSSDYDAYIEYAKLRAGLKDIDNAVIDFNSYKQVNSNYGDKKYILTQISQGNVSEMRKISDFYYNSNGIYRRACQLLAILYKYDWYITPFYEGISWKGSKAESKLLPDVAKVLNYFDNSEVKRTLGNIALKVIRQGVYYGIWLDWGDKFSFQQLPADYCRSRLYSGIDPIVELNLKFFDTYFKNAEYRTKVLKLFPTEVQQAYVKYTNNKLPPLYPGDTIGWIALDPGMAIKFSLNDSDFPTLISVIPSLIDLDAAQELDRKKTMQQLIKVLIQKLPLDKNGELIFDLDEARDIHNNAVAMLKRAVGIDVLTTFADIETVDTQDKTTVASTDPLQKVERTVYNNLGISQNLFNTEGSTALEKSVINDEASVRDLVYQFQAFLNKVIKKFDRKGHYSFRIEILPTTIYNFKDISKMYKEQTQVGFGKLLPQIALGHSQSSILATMYFENEVLKLSEIMIPPMMSSTMSSKTTSQKEANEKIVNDDKKEPGRPALEEDKKSEKTLANEEAQK